MTNQITLVTAPDDILVDGIRILAYDLLPDQSKILSDALQSLNIDIDVITYIAKSSDDPSWVLDKKQKCSIIVLNAESQDQTMVGYLAAQPSSFYFGNLRSINIVNNKCINSKETITTIMEGEASKYARI